MKKLILLGAVAPMMFLLTACGEGWEMRPYANTPYQDRTAGNGVEYVRAHMMPSKGPVVKAAEPKKEAPPPAAKTKEGNVDGLINSGEKYFRDIIRK